MKLLSLRLAAAGALALAAIPSYAFTAFYNQAAWTAAVGSHTLEDFESYPVTNIPAGGGTILTPNFDVVFDANHGGVGLLAGSFNGSTRYISGDVHGLNLGNPQFLRLDFNSPITAFGANFNGINEGGIYALIDGNQFALANGTTFFGVIGSPFSSIEFRTNDPIAEFFEMDDVRFRDAGAIPGPAAAVMFLSAFIARRRNRK
jgi:hypothetical protein